MCFWLNNYTSHTHVWFLCHCQIHRVPWLLYRRCTWKWSIRYDRTCRRNSLLLSWPPSQKKVGVNVLIWWLFLSFFFHFRWINNMCPRSLPLVMSNLSCYMLVEVKTASKISFMKYTSFMSRWEWNGMTPRYSDFLDIRLGTLSDKWFILILIAVNMQFDDTAFNESILSNWFGNHLQGIW